MAVYQAAKKKSRMLTVELRNKKGKRIFTWGTLLPGALMAQGAKSGYRQIKKAKNLFKRKKR